MKAHQRSAPKKPGSGDKNAATTETAPKQQNDPSLDEIDGLAGHSNTLARHARDAQASDEKEEEQAKKEDEDKKKGATEQAPATVDPAAIQKLIDSADLNRDGAVKMLMSAHAQILAAKFDKQTEFHLSRQVNARLFELMRRQIEFADFSEKDAPERIQQAVDQGCSAGLNDDQMDALNLLAQQRITAFIRTQVESADLGDPETALAQMLQAQDLLLMWWEQLDSRERISLQQEVNKKLRMAESEMRKGPLDGLMDMLQPDAPVKGQV